ncbi:hypothetical protein DM02DRAFT_672023 [Periconia macrospinosa]|uniref:Uncharacterized protein n=1 Tax=Periconia macrospinosa TaxID=97972 RepID=A0A2V1DQX8_9PLEO|nr:hypothetical protein DM02DRAFT_672023 [Periconia macrospinosa]
MWTRLTTKGPQSLGGRNFNRSEIFELAGRPIRVVLGNDKFTAESTNSVGHRQKPKHKRTETGATLVLLGLGNDKFTAESTKHLLDNFPAQAAKYQGSAFSGAGGRGAYAGGSGGAYDRTNGRDERGINVRFCQLQAGRSLANLARNEVDVPVPQSMPSFPRARASDINEGGFLALYRGIVPTPATVALFPPGILIQYFIQYGASFVGGGPKAPNQGTAAFRIPREPGIQAIPGAILLVGLFFFPYPPRWLASKDRWEEALQVLAGLHGGGDIKIQETIAA